MGVCFETFEFDTDLFELRRSGARVPLERQVFDVLGYLIEHRDRVVTKEELLDQVWGDRFVSESALTSRIKAARRALGDDGAAQRMIETTRGRGYRFVAPVDTARSQSTSEARTAASDDEGGGGHPPTGAPSVPRSPRHNLPVERTRLFGRVHEIEQISALVDRHRLVTLLGIGGTGKTRLATAVASHRAGAFPDGVWFVDLVPATSIDQAAEAIASAVGLQLEGPDLVGSVAARLADRQTLVVLDNCEHITAEVAELVDVLLERGRASRWLATSRQPLQLPDERQVHVSPLAVAADLDAPALQLFVAAAERVGADIATADVPVAAEVCANLDGLPLSIELAAAQLRHLSLAELSARLDRRFEILARDGGGRVRRQASLLGVLQDTWDMLDAHEHEMVLQLAAFPSAFALDDVEDICSTLDVGVATQTLAGLVDRSLISSVGAGRHRMLETVKLFARERWAGLPDPDGYLGRHSSWVVGQLAAYGEHGWFTSFEVIGWASAHYDDHRAVEDRFVAAGRTTELAALLRSLTIAYTYASGTRAASAIDRIERHLARLPFTEVERGLIELVAASAGLPARRPDVITAYSASAVAHLRVDGAPAEFAAALVVGSWMQALGDVGTAIGMLDEARGLAVEAGVTTIANAAIAYHAGYLALTGRTDESLDMLVELRSRLDGTPFDYAWSLHHLFNLSAHLLRDPVVSRRMGSELNAAIPAAVWDGGIGWGLPLCNCLAIAACGDIDETRRHVAEAEQLCRLASDHDGLPDLLLAPAALAWRLGDVPRARRWVTTVRRSARPTSSFQLTIMYRGLRTEVGLDETDPLDHATVQDVYREAVEWMNSLTP